MRVQTKCKRGHTRFYNKRHNRRGCFWGDRFKSVIVEDGQTLVNCLAYIILIEKKKLYLYEALELRAEYDGRIKH